jgi:hypothetical protein
VSVEDLVYAMGSLDDALPGYHRAEAYARGLLPERFANQVLARVLGQLNDYRFRLAAVPIEVMCDRVQVASVDSDTSEEVTARLQFIREVNSMEHLEPHLIRELFTLGDAYAFVWPVQDAEEQDTADPLRTAGVRISYLSPYGTRAIYHSGDPMVPEFVMRRWQTDDPAGKVWHAELWYVDRVEMYVTQPGGRGMDARDWLMYAQDANGNPVPAVAGSTWPVLHELGELPIKHARNALPYGRPEHIDAYGPQDAITKATITQVYTIEEHGRRERIRLMDDKAILDVGRDAVAWEDNADAPDAPDVASGAVEVTGLKHGPGTETKYFGTKSVHVVEPPDPTKLIEPIEQWVRMMATVTETPLYEFDQRTGEQMSGVARERADRPLKAKERDRKRYLGGFWTDVYMLACDISGADPGKIVVHWSLPDVVSDPAWWVTAETRERMGVPTERILAEANYGPEEIADWLDRNHEATTFDKQIARAQAFGEAMQAVGTAIAVGAVDAATAQRMLAQIFGDPAIAVPVPGEPVALPAVPEPTR